MLVNELNTVFRVVSKKLETKLQDIDMAMAASGCDGDGNQERQNSVSLASNGAYTVGMRGSHSEDTEFIATACHTFSQTHIFNLNMTPKKVSSGKSRSPDIREYFTVTGSTPTSVAEVEICSSTPTKLPKKRKKMTHLNWNKLNFTSTLTKAPITPTTEKNKSSSSGTSIKPSVRTSLTYHPYESIFHDLEYIDSVRKRNREGRKVSVQSNKLTRYFDPHPHLEVNADDLPVKTNMQAGQLSASSLSVVDGCETQDAPNVPKLKLRATSLTSVNDHTKQRTPLKNLSFANDRSSTVPSPSKIPHKKLENYWKVIPGSECIVDAIDHLKKAPNNCKSITCFETPSFEVLSAHCNKKRTQNSDIIASSDTNDSNAKAIVLEEEEGSFADHVPSMLPKEFVPPSMMEKSLAINQMIPSPTVMSDLNDSERKKVSKSLVKKCPIIDLTSSHSRPTQPSDIDTFSTSMRQNSSVKSMAITAHSPVQHKKDISLPTGSTAHDNLPVIAYIDLTTSISSPRCVKPRRRRDFL